MALPESLADLTAWEAGKGPHNPLHPYTAKSGELDDAWNHPLFYLHQGSAYTLTSLGKDGKPGGKGLDADIIMPQSVSPP